MSPWIGSPSRFSFFFTAPRYTPPSITFTDDEGVSTVQIEAEPMVHSERAAGVRYDYSGAAASGVSLFADDQVNYDGVGWRRLRRLNSTPGAAFCRVAGNHIPLEVLRPGIVGHATHAFFERVIVDYASNQTMVAMGCCHLTAADYDSLTGIGFWATSDDPEWRTFVRTGASSPATEVHGNTISGADSTDRHQLGIIFSGLQKKIFWVIDDVIVDELEVTSWPLISAMGGVPIVGFYSTQLNASSSQIDIYIRPTNVLAIPQWFRGHEPVEEEE